MVGALSGFARGRSATVCRPASFTLTDPDGNPILIDQHAPASLPKRAK